MGPRRQNSVTVDVLAEHFVIAQKAILDRITLSCSSGQVRVLGWAWEGAYALGAKQFAASSATPP